MDTTGTIILTIVICAIVFIGLSIAFAPQFAKLQDGIRNGLGRIGQKFGKNNSDAMAPI